MAIPGNEIIATTKILFFSFSTDVLYSATFDSNETNSSEDMFSNNNTATSVNSKSDSRSKSLDRDKGDNKFNTNFINNGNEIRLSSTRTTTVTLAEVITNGLKDGEMVKLSNDNDEENNKENYRNRVESEDKESKKRARLKREKRLASSYVVELLLVIDYGVFEVCVYI